MPAIRYKTWRNVLFYQRSLIYQRDSIRRHRNDAAAEWFKQPQKNPFALFLQTIFAPIAEQLNNVGGGELIEDIFLFRVWSHY